MTFSVDTNVIVALWDAEDSLHHAARAALEAALSRGTLVISGAVYSELLAGPGRTEEFLDRFFEETQVRVEWEFEEKIWRSAGTTFQKYGARRRKHGTGAARRILADFLIGAHALVNGYKLLTLDAGIYKASFPRLEIITV